MMAIITVRAMLPTSESINLAGGMLNQRKAKRPPTVAKHKVATSNLLWVMAMKPRAISIELKTPAERPSTPSMMVPEYVAVITSTKRRMKIKTGML